MRVHFIAPFRTLLNMHTECVFTTSQACRDLFGRVAHGASQSPDVEVAVPVPTAPDGFMKFATLEADSDTQYSTPLFTLAFRDAVLDAAARAAENQARSAVNASGELPLRTSVISATAHLFDNTIGVAHIVADITLSEIGKSANADGLDRYTSAFVAGFIDNTVQPEIASIIRRLLKEARYSKHNGNVRAISKRKNEFVVFDDISDQPFPEWNPQRPSMLWCNRTIDITDAAEGEIRHAALWARLDLAPDQPLPDETIKAGINVIRGSAALAEFVKAMIKMQYFYSLLDILNGIQRHLYFTATAESSGGTLDRFARKSRAALGVLDLALNEFDDFMMGVQFKRKRYCETLAREFDIPRLIRNVRSRTTSVTEKFSRLIQARSERRQKFLQGGIVIIGSFQILNFALDASVDAKTIPAILNDRTPGLMHVLDRLPINVTLDAIVVAALVVALTYSHWRRQ